MRLVVGLLLGMSSVSWGNSACLSYLRAAANLNPDLLRVLGRMETRWDHNQELISFLTGRTIGAKVTREPAMHYPAILGGGSEPIELWDIQAARWLLGRAVQFELDEIYLGPRQTPDLRAALAGAPSDGTIVGVFPETDWQEKAVAALASHPEWRAYPHAILADPSSGLRQSLMETASRIFYGHDVQQPWGDLMLSARGADYHLVIYGGKLDLMVPVVAHLIASLMESPSIEMLRVDVVFSASTLVSPRDYRPLPIAAMNGIQRARAQKALAGLIGFHLTGHPEGLSPAGRGRYTGDFIGERLLDLRFIP